jgi:MGT family glycosyltransferase
MPQRGRSGRVRLDPFGVWHDPLRLELGLASDPTMAQAHRYLLLAPMPQQWIAADERTPPTIHFVRPDPPVRGDEAALGSPSKQVPSRRPLVHATLGTTEANRTPGIYEAIIAGLREEPIDLLVAVGRTRDPAGFGPQPANVRIEGHVSHTELLPKCDVVVTHGGFGTIMGCLSAGVPMVILPVQGDQPRNARRCIDLGIGRTVGPDERTPAAIRAAVRAVLADPACKANAVRMQREIYSLPGLDHAVALLERLAIKGQPLFSSLAEA